MSEPMHTDFWVVLHTRTEHDDLDRLETRGARAEDQAQAFDLLCEMACITEEQRSDRGLFMPAVDILELCGILKELTGDEFEAMIYEEFVSRRTTEELPRTLQPATFAPTPEDLRTIRAMRFGNKKIGFDRPYASVGELSQEASNDFSANSWVRDTARPRIKTLSKTQRGGSGLSDKEELLRIAQGLRKGTEG